jgi:hypothetical protein
MLDFGSFKTRDCENGIGRRSFLKTASALPFAFGAGYGGIDLEAARKLGDRAKAKSVILLWLWGGPSHIDTFDPKPDAPMSYRQRQMGFKLLSCYLNWPSEVIFIP